MAGSKANSANLATKLGLELLKLCFRVKGEKRRMSCDQKFLQQVSIGVIGGGGSLQKRSIVERVPAWCLPSECALRASSYVPNREKCQSNGEHHNAEEC